MSSYRDDLQAARLRIQELEGQVSQWQDASSDNPVVESLRCDLSRAQRDLASSRPTSSRALTATLVPPGLVALSYGGSVLLAMSDKDEVGWWATNLSLALGLAAPLWSWGFARRSWPAVLALALKLLVLWSWAGDWWAPGYSQVNRKVDSVFGAFDASLYFFWLAPGFVLVAAIAESLLGVWLMSRAGQLESSAAHGNTPNTKARGVAQLEP